MEPTQANPGRRDEQAPPVAGTLGQVVRAGRASGHPIPVAAVVSIFDDLLAGDADPPAERTPDLDDVLIDSAGVARIDTAADLAALGQLLVEALDDQVPAAGRWLVERLTGDDAADRPTDAAQLRAWVRDALGQPADRSEVVALVKSLSSPLPVPEPVTADDDGLHDLETIPPNGALMAPLLGLGPSVQAQIPTDPIRKRTFPVGKPVLAPEVEAAADPTTKPELVHEPDTAPQTPSEEPHPTVFDPATAIIEGDADAPTLTMPMPARVARPPVRPNDAGKGHDPQTTDGPSLPPTIAPEQGEAGARAQKMPISSPSGIPAYTEPPAVLNPTRAEPKPTANAGPRPAPSASVRPTSSSAVRPLSGSNIRPTTGSVAPLSRGPETGRGNRPVVRHQARRDHKISVPVAPATRRTRSTRRHDSIMGPSDRSFPWGWLVLVGIVTAASYYLLFT